MIHTYNREFSNAIQQLYDAEYILPTSSGTGALMAALYACHIAPGDCVILPVNACPAVLNALAWMQIKPIFCDVGPDMQINIHNLCELLSADVKAIIIIHRFGSSVDMERFSAQLSASNYQGAIIEDGAQAFGLVDTAVLKPQGISDIYISSFGAGKIIDTDGGGVLITNNSELFQRAYRFINHGADTIPFFQDFGINFRMSKYIQPQIISQLEKLDINIQRRKFYAQRISDALYESGFRQVQNSSRCVYYRLVLVAPHNCSAKEILQRAERHNCIVRKAFPFLLKDYTYIQKEYPIQASRQYPNAETQQSNLISLYVDERFRDDIIPILQTVSK